MKKIEVNTSISDPFEVRKVNASQFETRIMPDEFEIVVHDEFNDRSRDYVSVKWKSPETKVLTVAFIDELNRALKANSIASGTEVFVSMLHDSADSLNEESKFSFSFELS